MSFWDVATAGLCIFGAFFATLAGVGIIRMPDLYTRMQAATKAGTLGVACIVAAAATHFRTADVVIESSLVILFLFATAPIASHLIARAAYSAGTPLWERTTRDEAALSHAPPDQRPTDISRGGDKPQ